MENKNELSREEKYEGFLEFLSNKLQVDITPSNILGSGVSGEVYDIGMGRVIKLTSSNIDVSYKLANKNIDGLCKVYSVGEIKVPKRFVTKIHTRYYIELKDANVGRGYSPNITIYYIIMEKLDAKKAKSDIEFYIDGVVESFLGLENNEKYILDYNGNPYNPLGTIDKHRNNDDFLIELIEYANNSYFQKQSEIDKFYHLMMDLLKIFKNVSKYFKWFDIHKGQFGYNKKGDLKAFDIDSENRIDLEYDHSKAKHVVMENVMTFKQYINKNKL